MDRWPIMSRYLSQGQSGSPTHNGLVIPSRKAARNLLLAARGGALDSLEYRRVPHLFAYFAKTRAAQAARSTIG